MVHLQQADLTPEAEAVMAYLRVTTALVKGLGITPNKHMTPNKSDLVKIEIQQERKGMRGSASSPLSPMRSSLIR
jgi:hypothetical protein